MARRMCESDKARRMRKLLSFAAEDLELLGIKVRVVPALGLMIEHASEEEIREEIEDKINSLRESSERYGDNRRTGVSSVYFRAEQFSENYNRNLSFPLVDIATTDWMPTISFNSQAEPGIVRKENYVHVPIDTDLYSSWSELIEDNKQLVHSFVAVEIIKCLRGLLHNNMHGVLGLEYIEIDGRPAASVKWTDWRRGTYDLQLSDLLNKRGVISPRSLRKCVYARRAVTPLRDVPVPVPVPVFSRKMRIVTTEEVLDG